MTGEIKLGKVRLPAGLLCILDPGLAHLWHESGSAEQSQHACERAAREGPGVGVVELEGLWAVAVDGLPADRPLEVVGLPLGEGEFTGRWAHVDLIIDPEGEVASQHDVEGVVVEHGLLAFGDPVAMSKWGAEEGHHDKMVTGLEGSEQAATEIGPESPGMLAFANRWGDGMFSISRLCDAAGRTVRVRAQLGTPERQELIRQVWLRSLGCIVTKMVVDDGLPIRFAERTPRSRPEDSGWFLCSGREDEAYMQEPANFAILTISSVIKLCEPFGDIILAPEGSTYTLVDGRFVPDAEA